MKWYWKLAIATGFLGAVGMAAAAFGQTGSSSPTPTASAQQQTHGAGKLGRLGNRIVHGDLKIKTANGFANAKIDAGKVTAVDPSAGTLTITRADGWTVSVTSTDQTRVRKQGQRVTLQDVAMGDFVQIIQIDRGNGFVVALIRDRGTAPAATNTSADASAA